MLFLSFISLFYFENHSVIHKIKAIFQVFFLTSDFHYHLNEFKFEQGTPLPIRLFPSTHFLCNSRNYKFWQLLFPSIYLILKLSLFSLIVFANFESPWHIILSILSLLRHVLESCFSFKSGKILFVSWESKLLPTSD